MNDNTLILWEENDSIEQSKKSVSRLMSVLSDGINETNNESVKSECEDIGNKKTKKCFHCQKTLPLENFNKLFVSKDGYLSSCRECRKEIVKRSCEKAKITHPWKLRNRENQYRKDNPVKTWASSSLYKHRKKYQVDISVKELEEIGKATSHCSICDCRLSWGGNFVVKDSSPSLDRVDNEHIISKENIQIICHRCNCTKRDRTMKEFLDYCRAMVEKFGNQ